MERRHPNRSRPQSRRRALRAELIDRLEGTRHSRKVIAVMLGLFALAVLAAAVVSA